jgi:methyltransferase
VTSVILLVLVFGPMAVEARRAALNEQTQRQRGGVEPPGDVYNAMRIVYPAAFLGMIVEGAIRGGVPAPLLAAGATLFVAAKALKWWAILSLGPCWTFRVIVVPGAGRVAAGPYRYLRHPNYVGVAGELVSVALMAGAIVTGPLAVVLFGWLLLRRIGVEEVALDAILRRH